MNQLQVPPQSIDAEEALISAILLYADDTLIDVLGILQADDFYRNDNRKIFAAIELLFKNNTPVDLITVVNALKAVGDLDAVGGASRLSAMLDSIPAAHNATEYARIINDNAILRGLISSGNSIIKDAQNSSNVADSIAHAERSVFAASERVNQNSFVHTSSLVDKVIEEFEWMSANKSAATGIPTGFDRIDAITCGLQNSDLIILAARPAMGKTAFALNLARNAAVDAGVPVAFFSLEMSKEQLAKRLLLTEARLDSSKLSYSGLAPADWDRLTAAGETISAAPIYIDDSPDITATSIRTKARRLQADKGVGLIIIDYLQLMKSGARVERRDLEISEISRAMKIMAKELNVPVIALSQLNRKLEERANKRPMLSDLRESGSLEQDADIVMFIYRDEIYNTDPNNPNRGISEIIVSKQRNGPTGTALLTFFKQYTRFENNASY